MRLVRRGGFDAWWASFPLDGRMSNSKNEVDIGAGGEDGSPLNIDGIYESALVLIDSALLTIEREE